MASDADWVEDVRRWYLAGQRHADAAGTPPVADDEADALGDEAACPPLQAAGWPDAPATDRAGGSRA